MAKCSASYTLTHVLDGSKGDPGIQGPPGEKGADARTYVTLSSGYDLNDCKAKDTVYVTNSTAVCSSLLNKPDGFIAGECRLEVEWLGSDGYFIQRLSCKAGDASKSFSRTYSSGSFGPWVELGTKGDKGDKGDTGATGKDGNGIASVSISYGVSDSSSNAPATWSSSESDVQWIEGTWLWTRRTTTYTEGSASDVEVTKQYKPEKVLRWDFSLSLESRTYDLRSPNHTVDVILRPMVQGYKDVPTVSYHGVVLTASSQGVYVKTIPDSDTNDGVFRMYSTNLDVSKTVKAIDATIYNQKFPASETAPTNAIRGDFFYDLSDYKPKQLDSNGEWVESHDHTVLLGTLDDAFSNRDRVTQEVYSRYGYFRNIVAKYIDVEELFADEIEVSGGIRSSNYSSGRAGFSLEGKTGMAEFVGARMVDCTISGSVTANDVQAVALKTVNKDVAGAKVSSTDMLDRNSPFYLLSDAVSLVKAAFSSRSRKNQLVDFSGSTSMFLFKGTRCYKAMSVDDNSTKIALKTGQGLSWPSSVVDRQDIVLGSFSVVVPIASVLKVSGTLAQRYYRTNTRESYTYYTDYAYWDNPTSRTGVVYVSNMNDGYSSESQPSNPSDGDTYTTYDSVGASNYSSFSSGESSSSSKPSTSWSYYTTGGGMRRRSKATDIVKGDDGMYHYTIVIEEASTYYQSYYTHTYHEGQESHTGYRPSSDNAKGGTQTAKWQYSWDGSTWQTVDGASMDIDIAVSNRTVYIRQIVSRPTATYYTANGTDTSSTTCPWGDAKTAGSSSVSYDLSKFSNGVVYAFDSSNVVEFEINPGAGENPVDHSFEVKLDGTTWFTKDSSDSSWLNKQFYKVKVSPFSMEVSTSSFTALSVAYAVYEGSSGVVSRLVTTGSDVVFSNSANCVVVDGAVLISKSRFYRSASASVTPNSSSKGVYVLGVQPQGSGMDIGSSGNPFDDVYGTTFHGALVGNVTGGCSGNAGTASKWANARTVTITDGTNTGAGTSVDGSGNVSLKLPTSIYGAVFN